MTHYQYYHHEPTMVAACIFTILFGIATIWHLFLIVRHRTLFFIPVVIGGIFEFVGYAARAIASGQGTHPTLAPYAIQALLLLLAPALFATTLYMTLAHTINAIEGEQFAIIKNRWSTKLFVLGDVICFFLQLVGCGILTSSSETLAAKGLKIILAGLITQMYLFAIWFVCAAIFHRRMRKHLLAAFGTTASPHLASGLDWEKIMYALYVAGLCILARHVDRVVEFVLGTHGFIFVHEVFLYVFDGMHMLGVMVVLAVWYPGRALGNGKPVGEKTETVVSA